MTDKDVEQAAEPESGPKPTRRARLAAWGAVALVLLGALVGAWAFFRLDDALHVPLLGPLAAKIVAAVLVFTGGALLGSTGARTTGLDATNEPRDF